MNIWQMMKGVRYVMRKDAENDDSGHSAGGDAHEGEVQDAGAADDDTQAREAAAAVEAEASKMGWTPKADFRGDPDKWRPADEFVERGKNMLPLLRAQVKKQDRQIAELTATTKQFAEFATKAEKRGYDNAMTALKAERAEAVASGDGEAFQRVDEKIEELKAEVAEKTKAAPKADDAPDPVFEDWKTRNKWVDDPKMGAYGDVAAQYLRKTGETATGAEFLELVAKEVKAKFPDKFENPRRAAAPSVEGGTPAARKGGGRSFADMPADARQACERMARNGFSDDAKAAAEFKAQYTKQFFDEA